MAVVTYNKQNQIMFDLIDKSCPDWIKRPDPNWPTIRILQFIIDQVLPGLLKVKIEFLDKEKIVGSIPYQNESANVLGYLHGGAIYSLGDTLAGAFLWACSDGTHYAVTRKSEIRFLRPIQTGVLHCTVKMKSKSGRKFFLVADYFDDNNKKVSEILMEYTQILRKE